MGGFGWSMMDLEKGVLGNAGGNMGDGDDPGGPGESQGTDGMMAGEGRQRRKDLSPDHSVCWDLSLSVRQPVSNGMVLQRQADRF